MVDEPKFVVTIRHPSPVPRPFKMFRSDYGFGFERLDESTPVHQHHHHYSPMRSGSGRRIELGITVIIFLFVAILAGFFYFDLPPFFMETIVKQHNKIPQSGIVIMSVLFLLFLLTIGIITVINPKTTTRCCRRKQLRVVDVLAAAENGNH